MPARRRETASRSEITPERVKGLKNEARVLNALQVEWDKPEWFLYCRAATSEEDKRGIDAVIKTPVGDVYLQVKSSYAGIKKFYEQERIRGRGRRIVVVIVRETDTPEHIRAAVLGLVSLQYGKILKRGSRDPVRALKRLTEAGPLPLLVRRKLVRRIDAPPRVRRSGP